MRTETIHLGVIVVAQAKTLTEVELKRLIDVTKACSRYPMRDVCMLLLTHWCGMRVGEVAALRVFAPRRFGL